LVDYIYAWHIKDNRVIQPNDITKTVNSIHFYDSIVVFEKTPEREKPFSLIRGKETIQHFDEPDIRKKTFTIKLIEKMKR
jgi:hypothetical protein